MPSHKAKFIHKVRKVLYRHPPLQLPWQHAKPELQFFPAHPQPYHGNPQEPFSTQASPPLPSPSPLLLLLVGGVGVVVHVVVYALLPQRVWCRLRQGLHQSGRVVNSDASCAFFLLLCFFPLLFFLLDFVPTFSLFSCSFEDRAGDAGATMCKL